MSTLFLNRQNPPGYHKDGSLEGGHEASSDLSASFLKEYRAQQRLSTIPRLLHWLTSLVTVSP